MPEMFRFLLGKAIIGALSGWLLLALMLFLDLGGIGHAVFSSANPVLPLLLLLAGFTITFSSMAMGGAVMMMPYENDGDSGRRGLGIATLSNMLAAMRENMVRASGRKRAVVRIPSRR